jgi:hypothetical protein
VHDTESVRTKAISMGGINAFDLLQVVVFGVVLR